MRLPDASSGQIRSDEMDGELGATLGSVLHIDAGAVQFDNALHDRKPQSGAALLAAIATPEAAENQVPLLIRDSGTSIPHPLLAIPLDDELDDRPRRRTLDGILRQIADRAFHHSGVAFDPYWRV